MSCCTLEVQNTPEDSIHYREFKIILQPARFFTEHAFREFWKVVRKTAKKFDVKVEESPTAFENQVREVLFFDTADFELYRNHFIVRLRTYYKDGWPRGVPELTVKFRHPDFQTTAQMDVRPATPGGMARIKFKEELLPLRQTLGGMRSIYSHNCVLAMAREAINLAVKDLTQTFPGISSIQASSDTPITIVNDFAVEEVQVNVGVLNFGHGVKGKTSIAVWRDRKHERPLCGEFAFQCRFENIEDLPRESLQRSEEFYKALQVEAVDWVSLGTTKTAMVYGLGDGAKKTIAE